ncbi:uncharacterized protein RJT21DRAFT_118685 [Scheffersomyces amazonensis]|uniref:uncharacterized protein n=1 Tax=Scheffersomyces amazonensis TaxID=1078765 RepID=UPI00315CB703
MSIPERPSNTDIFPVQHGYGDIKVNTHSYSDEPTPLAGHENKVNEFISDHTDREHQKKYAKEIFGFLLRALCN